MRALVVAAAAVLVLAASALAGVALPETAVGAEGVQRDGITVTGTASVEAVPDEAGFSFGVESRGRTAREALAANGIEVGRVLDALRAAGVAERDLRTQQVTLMPLTGSEGRAVTGYVATNSVHARIREVARAGAVVDAAVEGGANQVYGPTLLRSDREALYRRALERALANARAKAEAIAGASGVSVGAVVAVAESGVEPPTPVYAAERADTAAAATPVEPGTEEIEATLTVTFALR